MKILIYGVGALGSVYGCLLKLNGHQVFGIDQEAVASAIEKCGVKVTGIWGEHTAHLDGIVSDYTVLKDQDFDMIIVTVKAYDTRVVAQQLCELLAESTYVILAQNGYGNFEAAREFIPEERLILARVIFGAETIGLGQSKVSVIADDVVLGSPTGKIDEGCLEQIAAVCTSAGIPTRATNQIMKFVWAKIIYNSALNPLGAILEVPYGKLAEVEYSRTIMDSIIGEIFAVLKATGQETLWADAAEYRQAFYEQMIPSTALHHASMLQDIQRGRKTEIDSLNGAVVELGKKAGAGTPVNQVVVNILKSKETKHLAG